MPEKGWRSPIARLVVLSLSVSAFLSFAAPVHAETSLVIGEVNWAGSPLSTADEWIELWNLSDAPIDVSGYALMGAGGTGIFFASSTVIAPKSTLLVSNYAATDAKSTLAVEPNVVTSTVSLPNDHLLITLVDMNGITIDQAGDGSAPFAGSSLPTKTSMMRRSPVLDGSQSSSWETASSSAGFDEGVAQAGTPGVCDGCVTPEPVVPVVIEPMAVDPIVAPVESPTTTEPIVTEPTSTEPILVPIDEPVPEPIIEVTSTEPIVTTTSTETTIVLPEPSAPTTTVETIAVVEEPPAIVEVTSTEMIATTEPEPVITETTSSPPLSLRISRLLANPSSGSEWVELEGLNGQPVDSLLDWTISDAVGTIFRFTSTTIPLTQSEDNVLRVLLSGSHLNNGGDTVRISDASGALVDEVAYGSLEKDRTWPLPPVVTTPPPVVDPAPQITIPAEPAPPVVTLPAPVTSTVVTVPSIITHVTTTQTTVAPKKAKTPAVAKPKAPVTTVTAAVKTTAPKKTMKPPAKKAAAPKPKTAAVNANAPRVNLTGIVASIPGLLAQNRFVIQTEDGRGLLVKGNGKQPSPAFGTIVRLNGTLMTNDQGTSLQMSAKDSWTQLKTSGRVQPRAVDFFNPAKEDAWSLIHVTGTVLEAKNGLVRIDMDDATLAIKVRPVVKYRAERLKAGDVIEVTGLFEPKDDESNLYPRTADEIVLLQRAPTKDDHAAKSTSGLPPWSPFGAAGVTVALTQGYKRVQKIREQRRLEQALIKASQEMKSLTS